MLTLDDMRARRRRLGERSRGLMKERAIIREANDPLLYLERLAYLHALGDALAGVETARVTLAKALGRIDSGKTADAA
jgi:hypothetical protein